MISYYKTINGRIEEIQAYEQGCWINCVAPEEEEVQYLLDFFKIPPELMRSALDEEESSHIDSENETKRKFSSNYDKESFKKYYLLYHAYRYHDYGKKCHHRVHTRKYHSE